MTKLPNYVFVLDANRRPLLPCKPSMADKLQGGGKAKRFRMFPYTIILGKECPPIEPRLTLKIDPGSKVTGFALMDGPNVIWCMELTHRGGLISKALEDRSKRRRQRRTRMHYRKPGLPNTKKPEGWIGPSLEHRVKTIMTWAERIQRYAPVASIAMELVKFDTQLMDNADIEGTLYQQGALAGYTVREYLLEKWGRKCAYCQKEGIPLQVEHVHPKSKGGSDSIRNLCIACEKCNKRKSNRALEDFLSRKPDVLKRVKSTLKAPLKDAAAVNATRWVLYRTLKDTRLTVTTGSGAQTKFNRKRFDQLKTHWLDAACVGEMDALNILANQPLLVTCKGQGGRQKAALNKRGYPTRYNPLKPIKGWSSGDMAFDDKGELGRVNPRSKSNSFNFTPLGQKARSINVNKLKRVHLKDGYTYTFV